MTDGYNDTTLKFYHDAIRAGNPNAVIGLNNGVHAPIDSGAAWERGGEVTKWEDMTAGETNSFDDFLASDGVPKSRWVTAPTASGLPKPFQPSQELVTVQAHELSFMGSQWAAGGLCTCSGALAPNCSVAGCRPFNWVQLKQYTQRLNAVGAVLTVDLQLFRNGSLNSEQVATLKKAWDGNWECAADHGNTTCCCGQEAKCGGSGSGVLPGDQCTADKPTCRGFVYGSSYGHCVADRTSLKTDEHWFGGDSSWCSTSPPPRPPLPPSLVQFSDGWIRLVEDRVPCNDPELLKYAISCSDGQRRVYQFAAGIYRLSQQVWLPPRTTIQGVADPNVRGNARERSDLTRQTLFLAAGLPGCAGNITQTKMPWPIPRVDGDVPVKCVRKGFLLNDDTTVRNVNGQGLAEEGAGFSVAHHPNSYAGLNGGAFFELPGCVTTFAANGSCGRSSQPFLHGEGGDQGPHFVTGAGAGVANVLIENVRLNDALDVSLDPHADGRLNASLVGFWSAMTPSGEAHRNITLRKVVAMRTLRDGVNVHGHVVGFVAEDLHFENQGDDVRATIAGTWVHSSKVHVVADRSSRCGERAAGT